MNEARIHKIIIIAIPIFGLILFYFYGFYQEPNQRIEVANIAEEDENEPNAELVVETEIIEEGTGEQEVEVGDEIQVHYRGWLTGDEEAVFDESYSRGDEGFNFVVGSGQVIQGWEQGVLGMQVGEIRRLIIPSELAYGETERPGIPANSDLTFDVELLQIIEGE